MAEMHIKESGQEPISAEEAMTWGWVNNPNAPVLATSTKITDRAENHTYNYGNKGGYIQCGKWATGSFAGVHALEVDPINRNQNHQHPVAPEILPLPLPLLRDERK